MKLINVLLISAGIAISVPAFADNHAPQTQRGKTRAEVYAELIQAQKDGIIPTPKADYPPSQRTIERNQELYRLTHSNR
ncbi:TPA: DUF4148 domain-containing protein [Burkholderia vietnamiensis]|uniref:DUF4148 domain-containing protein n=1 Tax=Burkholderia cepacia complex TaxID=87882 RepID=UPI0009C03A90|nr:MULTISPECIES: DUF4148 domain-containing protein [Burkholderia cepacia complex]MBR8016530.1 DUF4148 domain-containing protein [Burkholderia vietnamiensis]HDR9045378.1 DUF4148 domain-containing protein [Burkholderia vietnamiensis]HDR9198551.1 DUF4148 domain-containing protein [Burkholderia vietnamiensis]